MRYTLYEENEIFYIIDNLNNSYIASFHDQNLAQDYLLTLNNNLDQLSGFNNVNYGNVEINIGSASEFETDYVSVTMDDEEIFNTEFKNEESYPSDSSFIEFDDYDKKENNNNNNNNVKDKKSVKENNNVEDKNKFNNLDQNTDKPKRSRKKLILWLLLLILLLSLLLGSLAFFFLKDKEKPNPIIEIDNTKIVLKVNETIERKYNILNPIEDEILKFNVDDSQIVEVEDHNSSLIIKGLRVGITTLNLTYLNAESKHIDIEVISNNPVIEIDTTKINLKVGEQIEREYEIINPIEDEILKWELEDNTVVDIENLKDTFIIKGLKLGITQLILSYTNAETKHIDIEVIPDVPVIDIDTLKIHLRVDETMERKYDILNPIEDETLKWELEDNTIASVKEEQTTLTIKGLKTGITKLTLSYRNALNKVIDIEVSNNPVIEIDTSKIALWINDNETRGYEIINPIEDEVLKIALEDNTIAGFKDANNTLTINALKAGTTTLNLTYKNAESKQILIEVYDDPVIEILTSKIDLKVNEIVTRDYTIINPIEGEKLDSEIADASIAKVENDNNTLTIKGLKIGITKLTLSYRNANDKVIEIEVQPDDPVIEIDTSKIALWINDNETRGYEIINPIEDEVLKIALEDNTIAGFKDINNTLTINALKAGTTTLNLTYKNADSKQILIEVYDDPVIEIDTSNIVLKVDKQISIDFNILNPIEDETLKIEILDSSIIKVEDKNNNLEISGLQVGTTKLILSYKNAINKEIEIEIIEDLEIEGEIVDIKVFDTNKLLVLTEEAVYTLDSQGKLIKHEEFNKITRIISATIVERSSNQSRILIWTYGKAYSLNFNMEIVRETDNANWYPIAAYASKNSTDIYGVNGYQDFYKIDSNGTASLFNQNTLAQNFSGIIETNAGKLLMFGKKIVTAWNQEWDLVYGGETTLDLATNIIQVGNELLARETIENNKLGVFYSTGGLKSILTLEINFTALASYTETTQIIGTKDGHLYEINKSTIIRQIY
ncbi:hypothetical protein [Spiroplasma culicicola]|uniref:Uncharacterized protein n=1 Tax=Spiroplasma culicicola AES-1 TaxID=1276246 RepID=W6AH19_9MOLU|nr:hypothetical protein [Spiroplasma culicicola]AHI52989.1 hypothetical protein SCULI_v1c06480 [Spiroplasma culicicola AES-1]